MAILKYPLVLVLALLLLVSVLVSADPGHENHHHHHDGDNKDGTSMCACQPSTWTLALNMTRPADCQHGNLPTNGQVLVGIVRMSCEYQAFSEDGTEDVPAQHIMEQVDFVQIHEYNRHGTLLNDDQKPQKVFVGPYQQEQDILPKLTYTSVVLRMSKQHDQWMNTQQQLQQQPTEPTDSTTNSDTESDKQPNEKEQENEEQGVKSSNGLRTKRKQPSCHGAHDKPDQAMPLTTCLPTQWKVDIYGKNYKHQPLIMEWTIFFTNDCQDYPLGLQPVTEPAATQYYYYLGPLTLVRNT